MTREILFRGKRTDNDEGEFVYGIPVEGEPLLGMGKRTYIITKPGVQWVDGVYMTYNECIEVDPETVGQFIGLTDKNGVKIFVGDIVHVEVCSCSFTGCVIYWSEEARYACKTKSGTRYAICARFEFKVIGNIYDNPAAGGEQ